MPWQMVSDLFVGFCMCQYSTLAAYGLGYIPGGAVLQCRLYGYLATVAFSGLVPWRDCLWSQTHSPCVTVDTKLACVQSRANKTPKRAYT